MGKRDTGRTETEGTGTGTGGNPVTASTGNSGRGRGRGTAAEAKQAEKNIRLPDVSEPKIVSVEVPKKEEPKAGSPEKPKRGRPAGSKTGSGQKKPAAKKQAADIDHTHIALLLTTMTGILSARPNMQAFALTLDEANQIAAPLASILSKNEGVAAAAGEYADHIALIFAAATIFIPKFLIYQATKPKKEKRVLNGTNASIDTERKTSGDPAPNGGGAANSPDVQSNSHTFNGSIGNILSPINGF